IGIDRDRNRISGDDSQNRLPAKRLGRAELQSRFGMVRAFEADQDPKVTGTHVGGRYIVVHLEPPVGVSQIPSDGDNPAAKAPSSGSIIPMVSTLCRIYVVRLPATPGLSRRSLPPRRIERSRSASRRNRQRRGWPLARAGGPGSVA